VGRLVRWPGGSPRQNEGMERKRGPLGEAEFSSDRLFTGAPEFLLTPLLMGPVCLISQNRFKEPVRP